MGRNSKGSTEDAQLAIKSLFGAENPFRRKLQEEAGVGNNSQPTPRRGLGFNLSNGRDEAKGEAEITEGGSLKTKTKKRKRDAEADAGAPIPASSLCDAIPGKRKKVEDKAEGEELKKKKKRKREDVEAAYERRMYESVVEDEAATVVTVGEKRKASDVDVGMIETKDPLDDESKLLRTIFVGNLPLKTKRKALQREFAKFGEIESVRIRSVPLLDTKAPRKAAIFKGKINESFDSMNSYIVFKDEQSARAALALNMAQIGGNHIRVDMACPPRKKMKGEARLYDRKRTVFVGNLPFDVKDEEVYQLFCSLSEPERSVEAVRIIRDPHTSIGKGIAYVLFKTREVANSVCKLRNLKIRDRDLRVCHAKAEVTPAKRKEVPSRDFPVGKRLATASVDTPSHHGERASKAAASSLSYQGLRSSKQGFVKKTAIRPRPSAHIHSGSARTSRNGPKVRTNKRPAVAARKAKQLLMKRKQMADSPENARLNKKARRQ
ncbi:hypothetical protein HPP92_027064 [Vanilla planifolia]|uniref:RRM domain-containing protein n=1 Tax=Vanilla planifolia TaxID=51239 RepID=A0A835PGD5_VANPL|nr:hypothetical protein HPP92_027064 [Vanilla planifolia]